MNPDHARRNATLPELEALLVAAATPRVAKRLPIRHRLGMPLAFAGLLATAGITAASAGVFGGGGPAIDSGTTPTGDYASGSYVIRIKPDSSRAHHGGPICLQLQFAGSRPAYGCGSAPTAAEPFGLVIADGLSEGAVERVIYGLVADDITRVSALGEGSQHYDAETVAKHGLPGRYFSLTAPNEGRIELVGFDASGAEVARIGSRATPDHPPLSHDEAVAQGDPAGFAPTAVPASSFEYRGESIEPSKADELGLVCVDSLQTVYCYDSVEQANAAAPRR
jgi:hypothetical protein